MHTFGSIRPFDCGRKSVSSDTQKALVEKTISLRGNLGSMKILVGQIAIKVAYDNIENKNRLRPRGRLSGE